MFGNLRILSMFLLIGMVLVISPGCNNGNSPNSPPYAVIGPAEETLDALVGAQNVILLTDAPGLDLDPDGDTVTFKSSVLPAYATLDEVNGVITVVGAPEGDLVISVWTEDEHGLASTEFEITLHFIDPG